MEERKPIDIIIPIYNAFDDLVLCIRSIRKHTDLTKDRIVLINDCSPDTRILPFLKSQEDENILVIDNESNQGFSRNVNKGMLLTDDRDVILLNSDTIVTRDWVDKIVRCAYSADEIGTVTPLSNSATLCSVPVMCQDNPIPDGVTVDEFAELIERCSLRHYPRITVAVGFCMFIKRKVIQEVGLFDAETFERGYGEENDFCNRAQLMGYSHVMCDDTFIYHKGTVSFQSEQKRQLIAAHDAILQERYPLQMRKNHLYCMNNPHQYIRDNINLYLRLRNGKKNILYLVQSDFRKDADDNVGGTQFHVKDMVSVMKDVYNVFVLARVADRLRLSVYNGEQPVDTLEFFIEERPSHPVFRNSKHYKIYENILKAFSINLVHVHHTSNLSFDIFYAAKELHIPVHLTLHDFYFICPNEKLLDERYQYCGVCQDEEICRNCLKINKKIYGKINYIKKWRQECTKVLDFCDVIYTPSESTKEIVLSEYPNLRDKIYPIYHGCEISKTQDIIIEQRSLSAEMHSNWDYVLDKKDENNMIVGWAFLENTESKDAQIYLEIEDAEGKKYYLKTTMMRRPDVVNCFGDTRYEYCGFKAKFYEQFYPQGTLSIRMIIRKDGQFYTDENIRTIENHSKPINTKKFNVAFLGGLVPAKGSQLAFEMISKEKNHVNWYILGNMNDKDLQNLKQDNLINAGGYDRDELPELLKEYRIDLVCILSIWPETFCYTISEALICGVPVLVSDIGAMGERMRLNECGWLIDKNCTSQEILEKVLEIEQNEAEYLEKKRKAEEYQEKTLLQMGKEYSDYYERDFRTNYDREFDAVFIYNSVV